MVVDTSALVAILLGEPEARRFGQAIATASRVVMSAATYVEFGLLARSKRGFDTAAIDDALSSWHVEVVAVSPAQARLAVEAFGKYGKGQHPARLNFGDCFAYALAKERGEPLLFKGDDFAQTDIEPAL